MSNSQFNPEPSYGLKLIEKATTLLLHAIAWVIRLIISAIQALFSLIVIIAKAISHFFVLVYRGLSTFLSEFSFGYFVRRLVIDLIILLILLIAGSYITYRSVIHNIDCFVITVPVSDYDSDLDTLLRQETKRLLENSFELQSIIDSLEFIVDEMNYVGNYIGERIAQNNLGCAKLKLALATRSITTISSNKIDESSIASLNLILVPSNSVLTTHESQSEVVYAIQDAVADFSLSELLEGINSIFWRHCQVVEPLSVEPKYDLRTSNDEDEAFVEVVYGVLWSVFGIKQPECVLSDKLTIRSISMQELENIQ